MVVFALEVTFQRRPENMHVWKTFCSKDSTVKTPGSLPGAVADSFPTPLAPGFPPVHHFL